MSHRIWLFACASASWFVAQTSFGFIQDEETPVEPADLARRTDLVGKKVVLDDHVAYYVPRTGE